MIVTVFIRRTRKTKELIALVPKQLNKRGFVFFNTLLLSLDKEAKINPNWKSNFRNMVQASKHVDESEETAVFKQKIIDFYSDFSDAELQFYFRLPKGHSEDFPELYGVTPLKKVTTAITPSKKKFTVTVGRYIKEICTLTVEALSEEDIKRNITLIQSKAEQLDDVDWVIDYKWGVEFSDKCAIQPLGSGIRQTVDLVF